MTEICLLGMVNPEEEGITVTQNNVKIVPYKYTSEKSARITFVTSDDCLKALDTNVGSKIKSELCFLTTILLFRKT
jgi:hypothetical protein